MAESAAARAHLNLAESSRRLFGLDPDAAIEATGDWVLGAGTASHPVISNAAFRVDDEADPESLLEAAGRFFGERGRGFALWVRGSVPEDRGLEATAQGAGFKCVWEMPEMLLHDRAEEPALPEGAELRRLSTAEEDRAFWRIAAAAYATNGFPPEVFAHYEGLQRLADGGDAVAFIAYDEGVPVSIAMTIVSHGVGGIYWVGSLPSARRRGLGRAAAAAATNAGFELGADVASLQASPAGRPIYEAMGYETIYDYRLLLSPPP